MKFFKNKYLNKWIKNKITSLDLIDKKHISYDLVYELANKMPENLKDLKKYYLEIRSLVDDELADILETDINNFIFIPVSYLTKSEIFKCILLNPSYLEIFINDNIFLDSELEQIKLEINKKWNIN
ncbi:hypothetical protein [Mycoplasma struthionis]|uniref:Uncharacterized protein n=1 Tax=Mycoplasma struthionis TaxID=538220 RepID=A0A3G8LGG2_9MOLU|nr:hypothetical protein [Mycoplasma struthionis]AZG68773.1 hypothetical protein EGN60_02265 [Mycoplasma struthionis]TPI01543.1 hypothetical protein FJM01_02130 [Mycoplasma struthionis]